MALSEEDQKTLEELEAFADADREQQGSGPMQPCPLCGAGVPHNERYPTYICEECVSRAMNEAGQSVEFYNTSAGGGFVAINSATGEKTEDHVCFIDKRKCWADERYFGGIVIQPVEDRVS